MKSFKEHINESAKSKEGWCVVFRGRTIEAGPFLTKSEASMRQAVMIDHNDDYTWDNLQFLYGTADGDSDDFMPLKAPINEQSSTEAKELYEKIKDWDYKALKGYARQMGIPAEGFDHFGRGDESEIISEILSFQFGDAWDVRDISEGTGPYQENKYYVMFNNGKLNGTFNDSASATTYAKKFAKHVYKSFAAADVGADDGDDMDSAALVLIGGDLNRQFPHDNGPAPVRVTEDTGNRETKMGLRDFVNGKQIVTKTTVIKKPIAESFERYKKRYETLNDAAKNAPVLANGSDLTIWYMKDSASRDFSGGYKWLEEKGMLPSTPADLSKTHIRLGSIKKADLEDVFSALQGEKWSPNGEARSLIRGLDLSHTSMSVGDIILVDGMKMMIVDSFGFREIKTNVKESDAAESVMMSTDEILKNFDHQVAHDAASHKPAMMRRRGNDGKLYDLVKTEDGEYSVTRIDESKSTKMTSELIKLAANCGIDARKMTVAELSEVYEKGRSKEFADQHDARLQDALKKSLKESVLQEWIPDKESLVYFEKMQKREKQIWGDAADVGILVDEDQKKEAREHLMTLMKTYGSKVSKWETGSTTKVFIPIEHDEGGLAGTVLAVSYNDIVTRGSLSDKSSKAKGFISIEISRKVLSAKAAKEKYNAKMVDESVTTVTPF